MVDWIFDVFSDEKKLVGWLWIGVIQIVLFGLLFDVLFVLCVVYLLLCVYVLVGMLVEFVNCVVVGEFDVVIMMCLVCLYLVELMWIMLYEDCFWLFVLFGYVECNVGVLFDVLLFICFDVQVWVGWMIVVELCCIGVWVCEEMVLDSVEMIVCMVVCGFGVVIVVFFDVMFVCLLLVMCLLFGQLQMGCVVVLFEYQLCLVECFVCVLVVEVIVLLMRIFY